MGHEEKCLEVLLKIQLADKSEFLECRMTFIQVRDAQYGERERERERERRERE